MIFIDSNYLIGLFVENNNWHNNSGKLFFYEWFFLLVMGIA